MYFIVRNSDGDTTVDMLDRDELLKRLNEQWYGDTPNILTTIPERDTNYWPEYSILIIEGTIKQPKPVTIVTEFDI